MSSFGRTLKRKLGLGPPKMNSSRSYRTNNNAKDYFDRFAELDRKYESSSELQGVFFMIKHAIFIFKDLLALGKKTDEDKETVRNYIVLLNSAIEGIRTTNPDLYGELSEFIRFLKLWYTTHRSFGSSAKNGLATRKRAKNVFSSLTKQYLRSTGMNSATLEEPLRIATEEHRRNVDSELRRINLLRRLAILKSS